MPDKIEKCDSHFEDSGNASPFRIALYAIGSVVVAAILILVSGVAG